MNLKELIEDNQHIIYSLVMFLKEGKNILQIFPASIPNTETRIALHVPELSIYFFFRLWSL